MRYYYLLLCCIFSGIHTASAQTYYHLPETDATWSEIYRYSEFVPYTQHFVRLSTTDTVLGGHTYRKLYSSTDTFFTAQEHIGGMREDTTARRIYGYLYSGPCAYQDMLMYDFNVQPGDTLKGNGAGNCVNWINDLIVHSIDSIVVDGSYRKKINLRLSFSPNIDLLPSAWVEGAGNIVRGLVFSSGNMPNNGKWNELLCISTGAHTLYQNTTDWNVYDQDTTYSLFPDCFPSLQGVSTLSAAALPSIMPNPVAGESRLTIPSGMRALSVRFYDMNGRLVKEFFPRGLQTVTICRSDFHPGLYTWQLVSENGAIIYGKVAVE